MHQELSAAHRTAKRRLMLAMGSLILVSGSLLLGAMLYLREETLQSAARSTSTVSQLIATQVAGALQTVDQGLHLTALALAGLRPGDEKQALVEFQTQRKALPMLQGLWLLDAQGNLQLGSSLETFGTRGAEFSRYFDANRGSDFLVAKPIRDGNGQWHIPMGRPIRTDNGEVAQVLVTSMHANYFESVWRDPNLGPEGSISLMDRDASMYSRSPFIEKSMSQSYKDRPLFQTLLPASGQGRYRDKSSVDGVDRWFAYYVVPDHTEMVVIAGQSIAHALARWTRWAVLVSVSWSCGVVIVLVLGFLSLRGQKKRHAAERLAATSNARYHALFSDAIDAILLSSPDGRVHSANRAACEMLGHTEASIRALGRGGLLDPTDPRLAGAIAARTRTGKFRGELTFVRQDGSKFEGDVSTVLHVDSDGEVQSTVIFRDVTARNRAQAQIADFAAKMQELTRRAIRAQEDERSHIARELHDELGQSLTAIKINLQSGSHFKGQDLQQLNLENIRIVEDMLQQVRQIAAALRPSVLDNLGLVPALGWLGKQSALRSDLVLRVHAAPLKTRLNPDLETTCFRIAQEAITNTMRHAKAKHLSIQLALEGDRLEMHIEDDGIGMDWEMVRARSFSGGDLGTTGMAERAALVGGQLEIRSAPNAGCSVIFRCTVPADAEV